MAQSEKRGIPQDELAEQAKSYVEDCLADGQKTITIVMTKEKKKKTWTLICS